MGTPTPRRHRDEEHRGEEGEQQRRVAVAAGEVAQSRIGEDGRRTLAVFAATVLLVTRLTPEGRSTPPASTAPPAYSLRIAAIGSMRTARRAGSQEAASARAVNRAATAATVSGSLALTP